MPLVNSVVGFEHLDMLRNSYLINNEEEKAFCVLYKYSGKPEFTEFEGRLMEHPLFIGHEDYEEYVLYKFEYNLELEKSSKLFKDGKYSMYTEEEKESVLKFLKLRGFTNAPKIEKILNRDKELREQMELDLKMSIDPNAELSSPPDMDKENFSNSVKHIEYKMEGDEDE